MSRLWYYSLRFRFRTQFFLFFFLPRNLKFSLLPRHKVPVISRCISLASGKLFWVPVERFCEPELNSGGRRNYTVLELSYNSHGHLYMTWSCPWVLCAWWKHKTQYTHSESALLGHPQALAQFPATGMVVAGNNCMFTTCFIFMG